MGAALHLAHAHQVPPGPKRKRDGGGGSGDGYDALITRIWKDDRQTPESRELLLLLTWLIKRDPDRYDADGSTISTWRRADKILGPETGYLKRQRIAVLVNQDRPRYEMARSGENRCQAPMIRREGECGKPGVDGWVETDPETGWGTLKWACSRHREWSAQCARIERRKPRVEPIPNLGGLLPCYFTWPDERWVNTYRWALNWQHQPDWEPPSYGLRQDGWPTPGVEPAELIPGEQPSLRLAALDGELLTNP